VRDLTTGNRSKPDTVHRLVKARIAKMLSVAVHHLIKVTLVSLYPLASSICSVHYIGNCQVVLLKTMQAHTKP